MTKNEKLMRETRTLLKKGLILSPHATVLEVMFAEIDRLRKIEKDRNSMLEETRKWDEHPEDWDGPCECRTCLSYAVQD